ncbi:MAG: phosphosulfolactate synthase [Alphaproteobacteria bacterium]|jgi:phosphosulfolactate synthase|nr:phosphosulfolactate synthase [Alphaproteobacteria bacterium]
MASDPLLQDKAFPFVRVQPRPVKPRPYGITIIADRGWGMNRVNDVLEMAGDYVDWVKMGIGAYRLQNEEFLRRKMDAFKKHDVKVFFAGDVTEAAMQQGVSKEFYAEVKRLGADAVEVSSAQISMSLDDKCNLIRMAKDAGLEVVGEAGQKGKDDWTNSQSYIHKQAEAFFEAGAWKVLFQGEGITEGVEVNKEDLLMNIAARFDIKEVIFQAKDGKSQGWYISTLGNGVNLDIDDDQIIDVELMRRNIRKRNLFGLIGSAGT